MQMTIPQDAAFIIRKLRERGFEAYVVGGCVRDTLLGREPGDWDITTSALPQEVKAVFHRTVDTGIRHGTVTVMLKHVGYEVTTYRIDGEYEDGRHPKQVSFTASLLEDLKRRDFTVNAMAYSPDTGLVDAFDGVGDLERRVIRCVGDPLERFTEDALRILRAIRFSAQLGFDIEEKTYAAIRVIAPNIAKVSRERIQAELTKLLLSGRPEQIRQVFETGISAYISPAFAALPWERLSVPASLPSVKYLRWAAFLRITDEAQAGKVLRDLKFDKDTIGKVRTLVAWSGREPEAEAEKLLGGDGAGAVFAEKSRADGMAPGALSADRALEIAVRRFMSRMSPELWDALMLLNGCSGEVRSLTARIRERGDCLDLKHLAVKGQDLLAVGAASGREIGDILSGMLQQVLLEPEHNTKDWLMRWAGYPQGQVFHESGRVVGRGGGERYEENDG